MALYGLLPLSTRSEGAFLPHSRIAHLSIAFACYLGRVRNFSRNVPQAFSTFLEACKINDLQKSHVEQKQIAVT